MLKKVLIAVNLVMVTFMATSFYLTGWERQPAPALVDREKEVQQNLVPPRTQTPVESPLIKEINAQLAGIKNIACADVDIRAWESGHRYRLGGSLYFEKPNNFRMEISSPLGKEVDLGSNDQQFWYWSRRDSQPGLYWARHEDFSKTRLKVPFNPVFMRAALGIEPLLMDGATVVENDRNLILAYRRPNTNGKMILYSVFVNKAQKRIEGFLITENDKPLAACEIQEWNGDLPVKILYTWHEENRVLLLNLNRPQKNVTIAPSHWVMPSYSPKINMAEDGK